MTKRTAKTDTTAAPKADVYERVTTIFVEALEKAGTNPVEWPWVRAARAGVPINVTSKKGYRGINRLLLGAMVADGASRFWGTFNQWRDKGGIVRKGEKGTLVVYWGDLYVDENGDRCAANDPGARKILYPKPSYLFHADQQDGWTAPAEGTKEAEELAAANGAATLEDLEAFVSATGAKIIERGDKAYFQPATDLVVMPTRDRFRDTQDATATEHFYKVLFHELVHWTGAESRLKRDFSGRFGSEAYAFEELVAEIGAAFLAADMGISPEPDARNVAYVAGWLKVLKGDKKAVFTASTASAKAADFLKAFQPIAQEDDDQEEEPAALAA
ncbi:ArdC family protein [Aureimonas psammosilenae]|uniref:ArdC family protein n=1 Tax=Aureimonas psammosilenae TaxID=2495496 RepID=UPI001260EE82|nr:zincin-like metallopeptidase domain-containing protein [Aureimonas psammosilenae]